MWKSCNSPDSFRMVHSSIAPSLTRVSMRFGRHERDRGVDQAVHRAYGVVADPARHDFPAPDLRVLEKQHVLVHIAERRKRVEQALDDQRAGHAVAYLLIGAAVRVRMVP